MKFVIFAFANSLHSRVTYRGTRAHDYRPRDKLDYNVTRAEAVTA